MKAADITDGIKDGIQKNIQDDVQQIDNKVVGAFKFILSSTGRLYRYMSDEKKELWICVGIAIFGAIILTFVPMIVGNFIDAIIDNWYTGEEEDNFITIMAETIIVMLIIGNLLAINSKKRAILLGMRVTKRMRVEISRKVLRLPVKYLDHNSAGDMTALITNDMSYVYKMLSGDLIGCVVYILMSTFMVLMMLYTNIWLGLIFVILIPLSVWVAQVVGKRAAKDFREEKRSVGALNGLFLDTVNNFRLVKTFGLERKMEEKYGHSNEVHRTTFTRSRMVSSLIEPSVTVISNIGYVLTAVIGAIMIIQGMISVGLFVVFVFFVRAVSKPMVESSSSINTIQSEMASLNRVLDLIDQEEISKDDGLEQFDIDNVKGEISVKDLRFSYDGCSEVLRGVSLTVRPGETVALIGRTGSGKSTLLNILLRFYDPDSGTVSIDGRDIMTIRREDLSSFCGPILQQPRVFGGTIMDNIRMGKDIPEEEVIRAAKITGLQKQVDRLADGYNTPTSSSAVLLVEMKLIALTRVLLSDPKIMIMDEATSGLDPRSEMEIIGSLREVMKGRTVIMTTHNVHLASKADRIVVMDEGKILEEGSHQELMAKGGKYSELYLMSM